MLNQDLTPYVAMKEAGANSREVFKKVKGDGYKNFECVLIVAGLFDLPLHEARELSHSIYREEGGSAS